MHDEVDRGPVSVRIAKRRGVVVAEVRGEIDTDSYRHVREELFDCLEGDPKGLVIDLAGVDFLASMGIAVLVDVRERADRHGVGYAVVAGHRTVVRPMRMAEVDALLTLRPTLDEALAAVRAQIEPGADEPPATPDSWFSWWSS